MKTGVQVSKRISVSNVASTAVTSSQTFEGLSAVDSTLALVSRLDNVLHRLNRLRLELTGVSESGEGGGEVHKHPEGLLSAQRVVHNQVTKGEALLAGIEGALFSEKKNSSH